MRGKLISSPGFDPYVNLALEALLIEEVQPGELILYLWRNARTVVIGRNQNPFRECDRILLEAEGGMLARRRSGGGAVYHDTGNLNFSFIARDDVYNEARQTWLVQSAVESVGIHCCFSGRNDLLAEGRKFSGSAYLHKNNRHCHHGTLMVAVSPEDMARYLRPGPGKLAAKGVDSIRARTVNLSELQPGLTPEILQKALSRAFSDSCDCCEFCIPGKSKRLEELTREFTDSSWILGSWDTLPESGKLTGRYPWGGITFHFSVGSGIVTGCAIETDAMDAALFHTITAHFMGLPANPESLITVLRDCPSPFREDLIQLLQGGFHGIL
ncbi:MAG: lipoate--protein ligase [Christensenellales bacterium]